MAKAQRTNGSSNDDAPIKLSRSELDEIGLSLPILRGSLKQAIRLHAGLDLSNRDIDRRSAHADTLEALVKDSNGGAMLEPVLRSTAVVGLKLLRGRVDEAGETVAKYKDDREPLNAHLARIDKLGKRLGAQLVAVKEDDDEGDGQGELGDGVE